VYLADCSRCGLPCSSLELRATAEAAASPAACRSGGTAHAGCRRLWRTAEVAGCCGACCMLPRLASRTAIAIAPAALTVVAAPLSDWLRLVIGIDYLEREVPREGAGWVGQGGWVGREGGSWFKTHCPFLGTYTGSYIWQPLPSPPIHPSPPLPTLCANFHLSSSPFCRQTRNTLQLSLLNMVASSHVSSNGWETRQLMVHLDARCAEVW